jgi:hypothetical protein
VCRISAQTSQTRQSRYPPSRIPRWYVPFNISDASGRVLVRDRGAIRQTYRFRHRGDQTPGRVFLDLLEERVSGPHPGFFMSEDEFCAVVTPLLS